LDTPSRVHWALLVRPYTLEGFEPLRPSTDNVPPRVASQATQGHRTVGSKRVDATVKVYVSRHPFPLNVRVIEISPTRCWGIRMESRAKVFGHPVHQMFIVFPLGLLATAVIFDIIYLVTNHASLSAGAYWMLVAGIVGGLVAAPFGVIDWLAIPHGTRAKSVGGLHGGGNVVVLLLFAVSWYLRGGQTPYLVRWPMYALGLAEG
jgi:uncharacterized membrane protein